MILDASSYKNLEVLNLVGKYHEMKTVEQVSEEIGEHNCSFVYEVTSDELNTLLDYLKKIAKSH
ncbi:MAG: hypothetical protein ACE5KE_02020 [Methanosarcinales archaeon]